MSPSTAAGRELLNRPAEHGGPSLAPEILGADILAIEAEARAAALDEAIATVEALPGMNGRRDAIGGALEVSRSAVLEALRGKR